MKATVQQEQQWSREYGPQHAEWCVRHEYKAPDKDDFQDVEQHFGPAVTRGFRFNDATFYVHAWHDATLTQTGARVELVHTECEEKYILELRPDEIREFAARLLDLAEILDPVEVAQ